MPKPRTSESGPTEIVQAHGFIVVECPHCERPLKLSVSGLAMVEKDAPVAPQGKDAIGA